MTLSCVSQVALEYRGGGSDKIYVIQVQSEDMPGGGTTYRAVGYYGRRGATLSRTEKYHGPRLADAERAAEKLEKDKRSSSGYTTMAVAPGDKIVGMPAGVPVFGGTPATSTATPAGAASAASAASPKAIVGMIPMLAQVAAESAVEPMLAEPDWVMQQKYDGERCVISIRRGTISASNRNGHAKSISQEVATELSKLWALPDFNDDRETIVDGELLIGDRYIVYDVLKLRDVDMRKTSFVERFSMLEELLTDRPGLLAPTAWTEEDKRAMLQAAQDNNWEGVMYRNINGNYTTGRSSFLLKHKLWATASCRVLTVNAQRSIRVALLNAAGEEEFVGNVTVPVNQDIPEADDLVEVRYLYAHEGGLLYQPTLLGRRDDISEADKIADLRRPPAERTGEADAPLKAAA
ncbi:DNA ligase [Novimethylophilus kurashikiensis]|uniref:DNA ligase n=1 Tax=Novimethylophilus kurashikiensis TaxID=1825523 RepID=A0A2R5F971_9PROT|nr:RNA ligase family protein [Novimethylophilus kurashikiensis]GBG14369.1 DNA ligase [Novimethylophilus kurashikiensis]